MAVKKSWYVVQADVVEWAKKQQEASFDAVLCDPPYELSFMSKSWDQRGVSFDPKTWNQIARLLKPGAHLLAFGGSRTFHRIACAIEDAGLEIRDCLMWLYGSGFPKSYDISKGIDDAAGAERKVVGVQKGAMSGWSMEGETKFVDRDITVPATEEAKQWDGWGTALKPAFEPIVVAMMPLDGTFAENALKHGVAGLNVDSARIGTEGGTESVGEPNLKNKIYGHGMGGLGIKDAGKGRWPPNVILDKEAGKIMDEQSGQSTSPRSRSRSPDPPPKSAWDPGRTGGIQVGHGDSGGASRFFYCAKAGQAERIEGLAGINKNIHPTVKPIDLNRYLAELILPPKRGTPRRLLVPFCGSGSEVIGAMLAGWDNVVGVEMEESYVEIAKVRIRHWAAKPKQLALADLFGGG